MLKFKTKTYFDGDGTSPPPPPPPATPPVGRSFTQAEVNKLMEDHRKGLQAANQQQAEELQKLRDGAKLTEEEKQALDDRIKQLTTQYQTDAQRAAGEYEKLKKKYEQETKALVEEKSVAHQRFEKLLVSQAIAAGSLASKALSAEQMTMILLPQAKVYPVLDEQNQPTGEYVAKVKLNVPDAKDKKKIITLELPITEAIEKMKAMSEYANLFEQTGRSGIGGTSGNATGQGTIDWSKLTPAEHRQLRAQQQGKK